MKRRRDASLAFSTCWNCSRHIKGDAMLREIAELGFDEVELGHGIRVSLWEGIEQYLTDYPMKITSLHNFCPLPVEILRPAPDFYQCTSDRADERERAQRYTFRTIDHARQLGVGKVVMHLGSAAMPDYTRQLINRIQKGKYLDRKYINLKLQAIKKRESLSYWERVSHWLRPVLDYARSANVVLGIENRIGIESFPSEPEFKKLFEVFADSPLGYWHDFGHAQVQHNLTFIDHQEWLSRYASLLVGCHVHDVKFPARDHQPPFTGMIDFAALIPMIPEDVPLVWELNPKVSREDIIEARAKWERSQEPGAGSQENGKASPSSLASPIPSCSPSEQIRTPPNHKNVPIDS